jgi:hypothetical protein
MFTTSTKSSDELTPDVDRNSTVNKICSRNISSTHLSNRSLDDVLNDNKKTSALKISATEPTGTEN